MNLDKLKGKLRENGLTQEQCAKLLDISISSFNNRINGNLNFYCYEAEKLGKVLNLTDKEKVEIFLS